MNKQSTTAFSRVLVPVLLLSFAACKTSTPEPTPAPATKTLNKATIAPKKWYTQGSSIIHDLKAGGVYGSMNGTWAWKSTTSDTMLIVSQAGYPEIKWKFYWNTDHEMEAANLTNNVKLAYKDAAW